MNGIEVTIDDGKVSTRDLPHLPNEILSLIIKQALQSPDGVRVSLVGLFPSSEYKWPNGPICYPSALGGQLLRVNKFFLAEGRRALYGQKLCFDNEFSYPQAERFVCNLCQEEMIGEGDPVLFIETIQFDYDEWFDICIPWDELVNELLSHVRTIIICINAVKPETDPISDLHGDLYGLLRVMRGGRDLEVVLEVPVGKNDTKTLDRYTALEYFKHEHETTDWLLREIPNSNTVIDMSFDKMPDGSATTPRTLRITSHTPDPE